MMHSNDDATQRAPDANSRRDFLGGGLALAAAPFVASVASRASAQATKTLYGPFLSEELVGRRSLHDPRRAVE